MTSLGISIRSLACKAVALAAVIAAPAAAQSASGTHHAAPQSAAAKNIVQVATDAGSFTTLVTAVKAAGLAETLQGEGPFTVFAPTDAAFAKLPKGALEKLLADPEALKSLLTFHVVSGRIAAADIVKTNGATPQTVNGQPLAVEVRGGKVYAKDAQVTTADVAASNGVIHVIDTVLMPAPAPPGR